MTDSNNSNSGGGGNAGLAFIVGGIVVVLAIVAYFVFARGGAETKDIDVDVNMPEVSAPAVPGGN
ncbi:MAG: hypothetical protein ACXW3O_06110 [Brevundimonas sp.]